METTAAATAPPEAHAAHVPESFIRHYIFSRDHKMIAKQYLFVTLFMAVIGGALAMLMRVHLGWPERGVLDPGTYLAAATMHGTVMIFFFLTTILTGFFGSQLRRRHNVAWYAALGARFYDQAARLGRDKDRIRMMFVMSSRFEFWRTQQSRLARELRELPMLVTKGPDQPTA